MSGQSGVGEPDAPTSANTPASHAAPGWFWHPYAGWQWHGVAATAPMSKTRVRPALEGAERHAARVELAVVGFVTALPSLVLGFTLVTSPSPAPDLPESFVKLAATFLAALGPAVLAAYLLWRAGELRAGGLGKMAPWPLLWQTALALASFFVAQILVGIVVVVLTALFSGRPAATPEPSTPELTPLYVLTGVLLSIAAGFGEELLFRAYAITRMEDAGWPRLAIWVPNAVWALLHLYQGWRGPLVLFVMAIPWVFLFRWKRSIWPLVAAHASYDVLVFLVFTPG